jgi:hypothetical protein
VNGEEERAGGALVEMELGLTCGPVGVRGVKVLRT